MSRAWGGGVALAAALLIHAVFALGVLPRFGAMYREFGGELPLPTVIVSSIAWRVGWALWLLVGGGLSLVHVANRRPPVLLLAVLTSTGVSWVVTVVAVYLPIFAMAGQIRE